MKTLDQSLYELYDKGFITGEDALNRAYDATALQTKMDRIQLNN